MDLSLIKLQPLEAKWLLDKHLTLDVLRLDLIHPFISGNKWFKLKYYLQEAIALQRSTIATFGGAWSNHIVATAFAAKAAGLASVGIIRGEKPAVLSNSLELALKFGMDVRFVNRDEYRRKDDIARAYLNNNWYWVNEGGYGSPGAQGAADILAFTNTAMYTDIIAAVGTGTTLAGIVLGGTLQQRVIGISSMKGNLSLEQKINELTGGQPVCAKFEINHDYHFGGYGKHPQALISFINDAYHTHKLPLDIVYTGKTMFAIKDLAEKKFFKAGSKLLMIHTGGLLGNMSLAPQVLAF